MRTTIILAILLTVVLGSIAGATTYNGKLESTGSQVDGTGIWIDPGWTSLEWWVTSNSDHSWNYTYEINVPRSEVSHFTLETSQNFTLEDIIGNPDVLEGNYGKIELGWFTEHEGSPGMPGSLYGIKFDDVTGEIFKVSFNSSRIPVWGDFYSKGGRTGGEQNAAWNEGFLLADPLNPAGNGTISNHILRPDTVSTTPDTVVPEPSSLLLLGMGLTGLATWRKRMKK